MLDRILTMMCYCDSSNGNEDQVAGVNGSSMKPARYTQTAAGQEELWS